mgnify:FL=1|jgi:hypothetical protein
MKKILINLLERLGLDNYVYVRELKTSEDGRRIYTKDRMIRWQFRAKKDNKVLYTSYADTDLWYITPTGKEDKWYVNDLVKHHVQVVIDGVERAKENVKKKTEKRLQQKDA